MEALWEGLRWRSSSPCLSSPSDDSRLGLLDGGFNNDIGPPGLGRVRSGTGRPGGRYPRSHGWQSTSPPCRDRARPSLVGRSSRSRPQRGDGARRPSARPGGGCRRDDGAVTYLAPHFARAPSGDRRGNLCASFVVGLPTRRRRPQSGISPFRPRRGGRGGAFALPTCAGGGDFLLKLRGIAWTIAIWYGADLPEVRSALAPGRCCASCCGRRRGSRVCSTGSGAAVRVGPSASQHLHKVATNT